MVKVRLIDPYKNIEEQMSKYGRVLNIRKVVMFKYDRAGDRIRILTYHLDPETNKTTEHYLGLDQEEAIQLFELMQEEL